MNHFTRVLIVGYLRNKLSTWRVYRPWRHRTGRSQHRRVKCSCERVVSAPTLDKGRWWPWVTLTPKCIQTSALLSSLSGQLRSIQGYDRVVQSGIDSWNKLPPHPLSPTTLVWSSFARLQTYFNRYCAQKEFIITKSLGIPFYTVVI